MQQDPPSATGALVVPSAEGSSPVSAFAESPPVILRPPRPEETWMTPPPSERDGGRLHRLLWIFALLTVVLVAPSIIGRVEYAITAARERARYDVAREHPTDVTLTQV